jgi:hypothetical protein
MNLPKLPQIKKKREASIPKHRIMQLALWIKKNKTENFFLETKVEGNTALPHQIKTAERVRQGDYLFKIPDSSVGKLPADYIFLGNGGYFFAIYSKNNKGWFVSEKFLDGTTKSEFVSFKSLVGIEK